jgi:uncharacterized protein YeaO (DUF488 family)
LPSEAWRLRKLFTEEEWAEFARFFQEEMRRSRA